MQKRDRDPQLEELGKLFRAFRQADWVEKAGKKYPVSMLAYAATVDGSWATIQNLEAGKGFPSVKGWCYICSTLQISIQELLTSTPRASLADRIKDPKFEATPKKIGMFLEKARKGLGWSIAKAWRTSNVSKAGIHRIEKGESEVLFRSLLSLLSAYKIDLYTCLAAAEIPWECKAWASLDE